MSTSKIKHYVIEAKDKLGNGQFMSVDATSERAAIDEFHEITGDTLLDWDVVVFPATITPTTEETRT